MESQQPAPGNNAQKLEEGSYEPDFLLNGVQICGVEHVRQSVRDDSEAGDDRNWSVHNDGRRVDDGGIEAIRPFFRPRPASYGENSHPDPEHQKGEPSITESVWGRVPVCVLIGLAPVEIEECHVLPAKSHGRDASVRDDEPHPEVYFPTKLSVPSTCWSYRDANHIVVPVERRFCDVDDDPEEDRKPRTQPSSCSCDLRNL
mmetsp:Transcript_4021/g.6389  ORF Transcript_4021/g.6389 Transcript_4021/m.6389 type:complete len:202 (-) Transcript_4021:405-1010(-)